MACGLPRLPIIRDMSVQKPAARHRHCVERLLLGILAIVAIANQAPKGMIHTVTDRRPFLQRRRRQQVLDPAAPTAAAIVAAQAKAAVRKLLRCIQYLPEKYAATRASALARMFS